MNNTNTDKEKSKKSFSITRQLFDFVEMLAVVTVTILLCFTFVLRMNIVDGPSMQETLHTGEYLVVSNIGYTPTRGDIVVCQIATSVNYNKPLVKRVIGVAGDVVDIDFSTWTLTVNGEVVDESSYMYLTDERTLTAQMAFPITVEEGKVFVLGDNRNHSADSRVTDIGQIDCRCIIGKALIRLFPLNAITVFENPYNK